MARLYDLSPVISAATAVFPGDQPFSRQVSLDFAKGDHLGLSSIQSTVHIGAHADAPSHYHATGASIDERALEYYYGPCQVITIAAKPGTRLQAADLAKVSIAAPRLLFRTHTFPNPQSWCGDFAALSPGLIEHLAEAKVVLVGIDTPSVDLADDKQLESHQAIFKHDMAILEGLVFPQIPDGIYTLAAFPLRIQGADAAPVRAVLIEK